ncbi:hypothetical protein FRC16_000315 [Serendipita sp. 398]|nr:hypothetical protein FRC16_000315 [Serendipita sp. 398]
MATQLAQRYPYLQQILVPRVILEDSVPISLRPPQFDTLTPGPDLGQGMEEESWMELLRKRLDVAIWVVEEESHEGCQPDCLWRFDQSETKDSSITITTEVEQSEPTKPPELTCHIENSCAHKRRPFRVVQPVDYNEHNQFKHKPELLPWDEYPKFWWSRSQRTRVDRTRGGQQTLTSEDATKLLYYKKSGNKSKLFNVWDL